MPRPRLLPHLRVSRAAAALLAAPALAVVALASPTPAQADWGPFDPAGGALYNEHHGICLDSDPAGWTINDAGKVRLWECNGLAPQKWFYNPNDHTITLPPPPEGPFNRCLDAWPFPELRNGYRVAIFPCHGGANQKWLAEPIDTVAGAQETYRIKNESFDLCLDTVMEFDPKTGTYIRPGNDTFVGLFPCHEMINQQWTIKRAPEPEPAPDESCNPEPASAGVRLQAAIQRNGGKRARSAVTTRYGGGVQAVGQLTDANGAPVPGATVCALGDGDAELGRLTTDPEGRFAFPLASTRSRQVRFVHRAADGAASATVQLRVRAPIKLRASRRALRNGQSVILRGSIQGNEETGPVSGAIVSMQARRGRGWLEFGTARTDRNGRFRFRRRFSNTTGNVTFQLRAFARGQRSMPFSSGGSRTVRVRVSG